MKIKYGQDTKIIITKIKEKKGKKKRKKKKPPINLTTNFCTNLHVYDN